jgi:hypothetical protein
VQGWWVFAGVLTQADAINLRQERHNNITAIVLDVTL